MKLASGEPDCQAVGAALIFFDARNVAFVMNSHRLRVGTYNIDSLVIFAEEPNLTSLRARISGEIKASTINVTDPPGGRIVDTQQVQTVRIRAAERSWPSERSDN